MSSRIDIGLHMDFSSDFAREIYRGCVSYCRTHPQVRMQRINPIPLQQSQVEWGRIPKHLVGQFYAPKSIQAFQKQGIQLLNISGRGEELRVPTVRIDDLAVGRMAASYFLGRGFRHFAFKGFEEIPFSQRRWQGFQETLLKEALYPVEGIHLLKGTIHAWPDLKDLPRPCALFCASDHIGAKAIQACLDQGISVPESIAVLGVDNEEFLSEGLRVPLSSIDIGPRKLGYEAVRELLQLDEGAVGENTLQRLMPPLGVVERQSSDLLAVDDELVSELLRRLRVHHRESIQVETLIKGLPVQRRMMERRFKLSTGRSIYQELRRLRLEAAKDMLAHSDLSVEEVAEASGIGESRQLSAMFKKEMGMRPSDWRNRFQLR